MDSQWCIGQRAETGAVRNRAAYRIPVDCDEILTTNGSYIMSHAEYIIPVEDFSSVNHPTISTYKVNV
ncbi:hypothetical protein DERP_001329 [Dermatophagoides pteronyssinus]|uniref:Uncharacterized protein n=1 Tax=Dermatophagoides pteronyssinus TaxID=6956 RepID=A0ABQ8JEV7_DERPT|nr:hypothetical protein DERP_001329 [Dermatophagoides pteronyssinus]